MIEEIEAIPQSNNSMNNNEADIENIRKSSFIEPTNARIQITWKNISIIAHQQKKLCKRKVSDDQDYTILNNVSGTVKPGQFLTIIGASGAGKTTLLNYLANRDPSKNITKTGEVLINGAERSKVDFEKYIGYVQQDDVLYQTLTVYECLLFAAKMRLPSSVDHNGRVRQILESLKLEKAADTKIGGPLVKGVSGGERKRASIAVELITDPTLIFLDEPTTGLDSYTATSVIEALVEMAASGRTVIATIHQPNSEMYAAFDQLMLMSQGKVIYMNKASNAINYFSKIGYSCPEHSNPADYFMNIMSVENEEIDDEDMDKVIKRKSEMEVKFGKKIDKLAEFYENSEFRCDTDFQFPHLVDLRTKSFPIFNANIFLQIYLLSQRAYRNSIRIKLTSNVRLISTVIISIIAVLVFGRLGNDSSSIQNRNGLIFFLCMQYIFNVIQSGINVFPDETPVFYREYSNRMYSSLIYFICRSLGDLPGIILSNTIMCVIVYFSNGLNTTDASHFFIFYFYSLLLSWAALGLGFIPGAIFKSKEAGFTMIPLFLIPTLMVSGFYVKQSNFIKVIYPLEYLSLFKYSFQVFLINEYDDLYLSCRPGCDPYGGVGFSESIGESIGATACIGFGSYLIAYICLMIRTLKAK